MEALQMVKYHLKQQRLDFLANWASPYSSLVEDEPEEPDDMGKRDKAADVLDPIEDVLQQVVAEEAGGVAHSVIVYK